MNAPLLPALTMAANLNANPDIPVTQPAIGKKPPAALAHISLSRRLQRSCTFHPCAEVYVRETAQWKQIMRGKVTESERRCALRRSCLCTRLRLM